MHSNMVCLLGPMTQWQSALKVYAATNHAKLCKNTHNSSRRLSYTYGPEIRVSQMKAKPVPQLFPLKQRSSSSMWAAALFIDTLTKKLHWCQPAHQCHRMLHSMENLLTHQIKLRHTQCFNFFQRMVYLTLFINFSFLFLSPAFVWVTVSLSLAAGMLFPVMAFVVQETSKGEKILADHSVYYTQWLLQTLV